MVKIHLFTFFVSRPEGRNGVSFVFFDGQCLGHLGVLLPGV
jgi:hypothetical protein